MRRLRWRIRTLSAVIAVIGFALGIRVVIGRRIDEFRYKAWYHNAVSHQLANESVLWLCGNVRRSNHFREIEIRRAREKETARTASEYHALLHQKYQFALEHPWLPVDPDPPPPAGANPAVVTADDY